MNASLLLAVRKAILTVLHDTGRSAQAVESDHLLATDIGLDSLDLAQAIVLLERELACDPFRSAGSSPTLRMRTVGDLVTLYEAALSPTAATLPPVLDH
ncbi:MAG: acyl carrier protein [Planctomycetota bacterium]